MAGHSQFKNIMYRKGAQDAKRARIFAKISREIFVAARSGLPDPDSNVRLRSALYSARLANMPKDNIDRALKKALGADDTTAYEDIRYEGYGPSGTAVIVETLTDNRNRTASDVRSVFTRHGGNLGESGSVAFQFEHIGYMHFAKTVCSFDHLFELALELQATNVEEFDDVFEIIASFDTFGALRDALIQQIGEPQEAKIIWRPLNILDVDEDTKKTLLKMIDTLEDHDDVQAVYVNVNMDSEGEAD